MFFNFIRCKARICLDTKINHITIQKPEHNHGILTKRRDRGQLKYDRFKMGLPAEYGNKRKDNIKTKK